ncbi:MAG TPA: hypothetical protein VKS60_11605 [Stellaceae bacterium]|nr:hypothetical protein [Stellaceae bacterium]
MKPQTIPAGEQVLADVPLLSWQTGIAPDLVLRWNAMPARPAALDIVLHLHGYATEGGNMNLAAVKLPISGLDFGDPDKPPGESAARSRPTLAILPRGRFFGGKSGFGYDFPVLIAKPGAQRLLRLARDLFRDATGLVRAGEGRRVLTAHSGGGIAVMPVAEQIDPHEIHVFDGLYAEAPLLAQWAEHAIARDAAALRASPLMGVGAYMERWGRALRVLYIPGTGTEPASQTLAEAVDRALAKAGPAGSKLAPWYRVEAVTVEHLRMPRLFGWKLLADAGAGIVEAQREAEAGSPSR